MSLRSPDPAACTVRLFGVQAIGESLTLADIDMIAHNEGGPPGVEPADMSPGPQPVACAQPEAQPTDIVTIVEGWIRATATVADGGPESMAANPPPSRNPATLTCAAPVKLRVMSTQWSAPVTMDSDRRIDLPSRHACVDVLTPDTWLVDPRDGQTLQADGGSLVWSVWLQLKICRAQTQSNYAATLTEQFTASANNPTFTVRPRSARRVLITSDGAAAIDFSMFQGPGPNFNAGLLRRSLGGVVDLGPLPNFTHLRCPTIAGTPRITYLWDVTP